jgi:hypothetical protein
VAQTLQEIDIVELEAIQRVLDRLKDVLAQQRFSWRSRAMGLA